MAFACKGEFRHTRIAILCCLSAVPEDVEIGIGFPGLAAFVRGWCDARRLPVPSDDDIFHELDRYLNMDAVESTDDDGYRIA